MRNACRGAYPGAEPRRTHRCRFRGREKQPRGKSSGLVIFMTVSAETPHARRTRCVPERASPRSSSSDTRLSPTDRLELKHYQENLRPRYFTARRSVGSLQWCRVGGRVLWSEPTIHVGVSKGHRSSSRSECGEDTSGICPQP